MNDPDKHHKNVQKTLFAVVMVACASVFLLVSWFLMDQPKYSQQHAEGPVHAAALADNSKYALVATDSRSASLWDLKTNTIISTLEGTPETQSLFHIALDDNAGYALTAGLDHLSLWEAQTGILINSWKFPSRITQIKLTNDGKYGLIGTGKGIAYFMNLDTGKPIYSFKHDQKLTSLDISQDNKFAITGSTDNTAKLWDLSTGKLIHTFNHDKPVDLVAINPDSSFIITHERDFDLNVWDLQEGTLIKEIESPPFEITAAEFANNSDWIAFGSKPQHLQVWDIKKGKLIKKWTFPKKHFWKSTMVIVHDINFSSDDSVIYTEDSSGFGRHWDLKKPTAKVTK